MAAEQEFDATLKNALEHIDVPLDAGAWALFESKLADKTPAPEKQTEAFDEHIRQKLTDLYVAEPAEWHSLDRKMQYRKTLVRRLRISKAAEAAIFLLLLANLSGMLSVPGVLKWLPGAPSPAEKYHPVAAKNKKKQRSTPASSRATLSAPVFAPLNPGAEYFAVPPSDFTRFFESIFELPSFDPSITADPTQASVEKEIEKAPIANSLHRLDNKMVMISPDPLAVMLSGKSVPVKKFTPKNQPYIAAALGYNAYSVQSGPVNSSDQSANAYVAYGYGKGPWRIETGLSYASQSFTPKRKLEIYGGNISNGYYGAYVAKSSAQTAGLSVKVLRKAFKAGKVGVSAFAGLNAQVALSKQYDTETVFFPGAGPSQAPNDPGSAAPTSLDQRGILRRGRFQDNSYAMLEAGIRIEYPINRRMTAFIEPSYRKQIAGKGFGPAISNTRSTTVQAGVMRLL